MSPPKVSEDEKKKFRFPKIELHLHLDGSPRFSTLLDLSKQKGIPLGKATTVEELKELLVTHEPANLAKVLQAFAIFLPVIIGDAEAIERVAYELGEDQAAAGVIYFEARYSAHLLSNTVAHPEPVFKGKGDLSPRDVVRAVKRGLDRAEKDFGVVARSILCCIRGLEQFDADVLQLVTDMRDEGVVAIDVAGSAHGADEQYKESTIHAFQEATRRGLHRTAHAGESGGPREVHVALDEMHAERIGHGYRVMRDEEMYRKNFVEGRRVHLEACPYSSVMTGAVPLDWPHHPIHRWAKDNVNFSISRDDPTCFDNTVASELKLVQADIGLSVEQIWLCQLNAAWSCFAEEPLKSELVKKVEAARPPPAS